MQSGQYITDRLMPKMIHKICDEQGISFTSFSDEWLLQLEKDGKVARVLGYKFGLNDSVSGYIAQDKVASYELMKYHDVPAVPHHLIRTKAGDANWKELPWSEGMVVKPLTGTSGRGVAKCHTVAEAEVWMEKWGIEAWAVSPFIDIKREVRLILLDERALLIYEKRPTEIDGLKFFNLGKGAIAIDCRLGDSEVGLAKKAQNVLGLRLCAVDIIELNDGSWRVLEVNDGFMMENYARASPENKAKTLELYTEIVQAIF